MTKQRHLILKCEECNNKWIKHFDMPMLVSQFVVTLKMELCGNCRSSRIVILTGESYRQALKELDPNLYQQVEGTDEQDK